MNVSLTELVEALRMASELPWHVALPVYGAAYAVFIWLAAKAYKAWREALKK